MAEEGWRAREIRYIREDERQTERETNERLSEGEIK